MPARVHAFLVVRPEGRTPAALHLRRTLDALGAQTRRVDKLTIVLCGPDATLTDLAATSGAEGVITASRSTSFATAVRMATARLDGDAVWLLAQDTAPEPDALAVLAGALELAPSVAIVAPKLVQWDDRAEIVSLGVSMTPFGRTVGLADGELDQGQHDGDSDVLSADVRGMLVRADAWRSLSGLDPALAGADEGLDLGVRARLAGGRLGLVPGAHIAVAGDGVAGLPAPDSAARIRRRTYASRVAQLHRRLVYAQPLAVPFLWLAILPLAIWRTALHLVEKAPGRVLPEWAAALTSLVRLDAVARARGRIRSTRSAPWSQLVPLRVTRTQLRQRFDADSDDMDATAPVVRTELRFFSGGGAWAVLAALVVGVAAFPALLAWPVLGGGALAPLRSTVAQLWADAGYGLRGTGFDAALPADPFAAVVAVLGTLWPAEPSRALVLLWVLALPLAVLGGWFAATRVTERPLLRITGGVVWALAPTFLTALVDGRPTAVLVHLLLPWLFFAGSVAHRSWAASGAASLVFAAVVACSPSLAPALVVLWVVALLLTLIVRAGRGIARVAWLVVPAVVLAAPLAWYQLRAGNPWALLADPGVTWAGPQVDATSAGRALLLAGFPTTDPAGWGAFLTHVGADLPTWWVPLLVAPIAVLALLAPLTPRWGAALVLLAVAALGIGTAFAAVNIAVASTGDVTAAVWPGAGLSLAWLGALGGALVFLDVGIAVRLAPVRRVIVGVVLVAIAGLSVPALAAPLLGLANLTNGPASTLPAYVAAAGRDDPSVGTIVVTPLSSGDAASRIVWGESETLGGQSTALETRTSATAADEEVAGLTADLVTTTSPDVVARLAARGIDFILLAPSAAPESDRGRALRLQAATAIDQRDGLEPVGETAKGTLWRVSGAVTSRTVASTSTQGITQGIALAQLGAVAVALLLAVPTRASRGHARRSTRVVGPAAREAR
ncbi:MAG: glycosyltransferase [Actinobacteria bacterium]|nr:glycosyltransferase [Actinomycetota bacterium]